MHNSKPKITVIGSINMDLVVRCRDLPLPGQTLMAESSLEICGGKGANQAVAASRAGGDVCMIGRVGDDAFAKRLIANLDETGVKTERVLRTENCASGLAVVAVDRSGQNSILVVPGSNGKVTVGDVETAKSEIENSDVLLLQLEIPMDTVVAAIEVARSAGVRVIMDPAPAPVDWRSKLFDVDLICPNETEATTFVGTPVDTVDQAEDAARAMHAKGAANVAITMGERGTLLFDGQQAQLIRPYEIQPVDSTAAGDAFAGAFAVHWAKHNNLIDAVQFGNAAGALSASRSGAQPSMATGDEIERFRSSNK